jgi:hypothetical protein
VFHNCGPHIGTMEAEDVDVHVMTEEEAEEEAEDVDVHVVTEEEEEAKVRSRPSNAQETKMADTSGVSLLDRMNTALTFIQRSTFDIVETIKQRAFDNLRKARHFLSNLIRKDHDTLEVDSAISQNMIDKLTNQVNCLLITASWLGVFSSLYNVVTGVFIILGDDGESTLLERSLVAIPPAVISSTVTAVVIFLQQLQIVDKLKELTNVKADTDYVVSKLEPMYQLAERADSIEALDKIDAAFCGETSALKQKARRAISKVLKKEDRAVHLRKYRYLMLQEDHAKEEHEFVRDLIKRYRELGIPLSHLARRVEEYGAFSGTTESIEEKT